MTLNSTRPDAGGLEDAAEYRQVANLAFAHAGNVASQQTRDDDKVDVALMVEDEDRGPVGPEVLLSLDARRPVKASR